MSAPLARHWCVLETEPSLGFQALICGPQDTGDWRQSHEALWSQLVAMEMSLQPVLEQLWAALLVIHESVPHMPRVSEFRWEILVCTAVVIVLVKSGRSLRRRRGQCAQGEVSEKGVQETGAETQACEAVASPVQKASPLPLQILALEVLNKTHSYFSVKDAAQLLKGIGESPPNSPSPPTDENPISRASQEDGEPPARKITEGSNASPDVQGSQGPRAQEIGSGGQREQEEAEEEGRPELPSPGVQPAAGADRSQLQSLGQIMLKMLHVLELVRHQLDGAGSEGQGRREAATGPIHPSAHYQNGSPLGVHVPVPSGGGPEKKGKLSRELMKQNKITAELRKQVATYQAEELSLRLQNTLLDSEINKVRQQLKVQPETWEEHILQLERKLVEEQTLRLEVENELIKIRRKADEANWNFSLYRKMAEDLSKEREKICSLHERDILVYEKRSDQSQKAAWRAERELRKLREENRWPVQNLVNLGPRVQPVPWGPPAPVLSTAPRRPQGPGALLNPQRPQQGARVCPEGSRASGPLQV